MTLDIHAHIVPEELLDAVRAGQAGDGIRLVRGDRGGERFDLAGRHQTRPLPADIADLQPRLEEMDRAGVQQQALSNWMDLSAYDLEPAAAERFLRLVNDCIANVVKTYPDRFVGLASVPLQAPEKAVDELQRAMQQLEFIGAEIGTNVAGSNLDEPSLEPFWEAAESLRAILFVHPFNTMEVSPPRLDRYYLSNLIANPLDTAIAGASLIFGGVLERHPKLVVCLAHGGGHLPYQLGRLERGYHVRVEAKQQSARGPAEVFKQLYFDSLLHSTAALEFLVSLVGADHVLLGSDYPFDMGEPDPVRAVELASGLSADERAAIFSGNAKRLLGT